MTSKHVDPSAVSMLEAHELLEDLTDRGGDPNVTIRQIAQQAMTTPGYLEEVGRLLSNLYFLSGRPECKFIDQGAVTQSQIAQ